MQSAELAAIIVALVSLAGTVFGIWRQARRDVDDVRLGRDALVEEIRQAVWIQARESIRELTDEVNELREREERSQRRIADLQNQINDQRIVINGLITGVNILIQQLHDNDITPKWRPVGYVPPPAGEE